jgi:hypothetical protein
MRKELKKYFLSFFSCPESAVGELGRRKSSPKAVVATGSRETMCVSLGGSLFPDAGMCLEVLLAAGQSQPLTLLSTALFLNQEFQNHKVYCTRNETGTYTHKFGILKTFWWFYEYNGNKTVEGSKSLWLRKERWCDWYWYQKIPVVMRLKNVLQDFKNLC